METSQDKKGHDQSQWPVTLAVQQDPQFFLLEKKMENAHSAIFLPSLTSIHENRCYF
jgi:hypothetical protein